MNGQEKLDELNNDLMTAEFWEYDSRIGRRWNIDPVEKVEESPYMCFSGNPVWLSDPNGDSTPVKINIIDKDGQAVTKPTVMTISCDVAKGVPGMKCVGNNRIEVTPGTYNVDYVPNNTSLVNTFIQNPTDAAGGINYTWNPGSPPSSPTQPPPPPIVAAAPTLQYNNQITGVTPVNGVVGQLNVNLANQRWTITGVGNTFQNPTGATTAIGSYARQLRGFGITTTNLTIGTILASPTTPDPPGGVPGRLASGVIRDRATTVRGILGGFGVRVGTVNASYGQNPPVLTAQTNANQVGIIGWNITTQAMQRQVLRGNVVPGSVRPVQGQNPVGPIFQRNTGGGAPRQGNYTGWWRSTL